MHLENHMTALERQIQEKGLITMFTTSFRLNPAFASPSDSALELVKIGADFSGVIPARVSDTLEKRYTLEYARESYSKDGERVTVSDGVTFEVSPRSNAADLFAEMTKAAAFFDNLTAKVMKDAIKYAKNPRVCAPVYRISVKYSELVRKADSPRENGHVRTEYACIKSGIASAQFNATPDALRYAYVKLQDECDDFTDICILFRIPSPEKNAVYFNLTPQEGKRRNEGATFQALLTAITDETRRDDERRDENRKFFTVDYEYNAALDPAFSPCKIVHEGPRVFLDA